MLWIDRTPSARLTYDPSTALHAHPAALLLRAFPNPATDRMSVYMVGDNSRKELKLYDLSGKLIYSQPVNDMFTTLDLHKLTKGLYIVKITSMDGKVLHSERIVKN